MTTPVLYETHSHTPLCKHAKGQPTEYAAVAQQRGLRGLTVTCHNPMPDGFSAAVRMSEEELPEYLDLVAQTREAWSGEIDVLLGLEADYFEGHESYVEKQLQSADFNYVLGSVHPQIGEFRNSYWTDDPLEVQRTYFRLIAQAAETKLFDSMSHPDLVKNEFVDQWDESLIFDDICRALDRVAATGVAMELNTSGRKKRIREMNPFPKMLKAMSDRNIPITLGADAHVPERVADSFGPALDLLAECGYTHVSHFIQRQRVDVEITVARASLVDLQPTSA